MSMLKVGAVVSPRYNLASIFYLDYHRALEDLHRYCHIFLAGNMELEPKYVDAFFPLKPKRLSIIFHNRYAISLSNLSSIFEHLRKELEAIYNQHISKNLIFFFKKYKPNLLYVFPRYPDSYHIMLNKELSTKIVIEFWEDQIEHLCEELETSRISGKYISLEEVRGYTWLKNTIQMADHIVVPTTVLKQRLISLGGKASAISVVPVCQDPIIPRDPLYVKKKYNFRTERILLYLGSLSAYHDLRTLFQSLKEVKSSNIVLFIAGGIKTNILKKYYPLIKDLKIPVIYLGRLSKNQLEYYISAADVCLGIYKFKRPSGFFPASVVKFMLAGKPIIVTDLPEIREMFKNKKACLFVEQKNATQLAHAIDFLLNNPEEGFRLGDEARKIAYENYLWTHHTEKLIEIFSKMAT